jgi:hypothetical protein
MAKFSQAFLQSMTQPSYQEGLFTAARELGGLRGRLNEERRQAELKKQEEERLAKQRQYQANLLSLGASGTFDPEMLKGALGGAAELGMSPAVAAQAIQAGQGFRPKPRLTVDQKEKLLENFTADSVAEYERTGNTASFVRIGPEIKYERDDILNINTGNVESVRIGYKGDEEVSRTVLGILPTKDGSGGISSNAKLTLEALAKERGVEIDYDSISSLESLQRLAGTVLDDASLANSFNALIDKVKDRTPGLTESLTVMRSINPNMASAEADLDTARKFLSLDRLTSDNVAGLVPLIERVVTSAYPNDIKAQQELNRFRGSKDIIRRISDAVTMAVSGTLTDDTFREYRQIMAGVQELASKQIVNEAINTYSIADNDREKNAALNVIKMYGGKIPARIVP